MEAMECLNLSDDEEETFYDAEDMDDSKLNASRFIPREYQVNIINAAIKENTIVFLPTGSGKTFISIKVIEHFLSQEKAKKAFFLVNTVALVSQQAAAIRIFEAYPVGEYSGEMGVDYWDDNKWSEELNSHQIFVMTSQIFLDLLQHSRVASCNASVIIFDECHHAVSNHPMKQIMSHLKEFGSELPRIVGLTAALLNANHTAENKIISALEDLESTFLAKIMRAVNHEMVLQYSANPQERIIYYPKDSIIIGHSFIVHTLGEISKILKEIPFPDNCALPMYSPDNTAVYINKKVPVSSKFDILFKDVLYISINLGPLCAAKCILGKIAVLERLKLISDDWVVKTLNAVTSQLHFMRKWVLNLSSEYPNNTCTEKVKKLLEVLKNMSDCHTAIVFVDRRSTAQVLSFFLKDICQQMSDFKHLKPDFVVGTSVKNLSNLSREGELTRKTNSFILKKFKKKQINVLFASNVIEEGVDIPMCNLVIKFDQPVTFRSYIQSKGRARHKESEFIVFADESFNSLHSSFKLTETILSKKLINRGGVDPANDDGNDSNYFYQIGGPEGPRVTALGAVSLLNRYCLLLPQDKLTNLTVEWWTKSHTDSVTGVISQIAYLHLPMNSPLRGFVEGPPRKSKQSAMRHAALKACKELHLLGELNSFLLPYGKDSDILSDPHWWPKWQNKEGISGKPGTKKMKRMYIKKCPDVFLSCCPEPERKAYVHVIKIKPTFSNPSTTRLQAFYDLLESSRTFGIITSCILPEVFPFPLYMNVGEVLVEIKMNKLSITLSQEEIDKLRDFQFILFNDALSLASSYLIKDLSNKEDSFLVAPVIYDNDTVELDWNVLNSENYFPEVKPLPFGKRLNHDVTSELYLNNIVIPWYRAKDETLKYVVTRVRTDLNPDSEFPENNFPTYASYFNEKYNQSVFDMNQPLIEVRAISSHINCIKPRGKPNRKKEETHEETFIPELCYLVDFPAVYALKISLMPSLLYRLTQLLSADELRKTIAEETGLGNVCLGKKEQWKSFSFDKITPVVEEKGTSEIDQIINFRSNDFNTEKSELIDITREIDIDIASIVYYVECMSRQPIASPKRQVLSPKSAEDINVAAPPLNILERTLHSGHGPELREFVMVLTAASAHDLFNYERLELLGDSFLKFAASLALFTKFHNKDEGKLSTIKGKTIGNANLFFCGEDILGPRLVVDQFSPSEWKIPGFTVPAFLLNVLQKSEVSASILGDLHISLE